MKVPGAVVLRRGKTSTDQILIQVDRDAKQISIWDQALRRMQIIKPSAGDVCIIDCFKYLPIKLCVTDFSYEDANELPPIDDVTGLTVYVDEGLEYMIVAKTDQSTIVALDLSVVGELSGEIAVTTGDRMSSLIALKT